jgi:hypothetical protein
MLLILVGLGQDQAATKVDLGVEFRIKNGEEVVVRGEKLRITFRSIVNDSRCPDGAACVWAGNAAIAIDVSKKNKKQISATLNTLMEPKEIGYKGFKIKLLALDPHPTIKGPIDPKDYEATLIVTKDE